jgi:hypothetical protein
LRKLNQIRKHSSGQAIVEMALVFIPLLMLLFGIIDVGWVMYRQITLGAAAREGLRTAAINSFDTGLSETQVRDVIKDRIISYGPGLGLKRSDIVITVSLDGGTVNGNQPEVTVDVTLVHGYVGAMLWIGQNSINLKSVYKSAIATWTGNVTPRYSSG